MRQLIAVLAAFAAVTACSSGSKTQGSASPKPGSATGPTTASSAPSATQTATASAAASPAASAPAADCNGIPYRRIVAADNSGVGVVPMGTGEHGVLMLPQYQSSACVWQSTAQELVAAGYRVLLLEYRCTQVSDCPTDADAATQLQLDVAAGVKELHAEGAKKVVIVGASAGGTLAIVAGAAAGPLVNGVIDLSGPADVSNLYGAPNERLDSFTAAPKLVVPALMVLAQEDPSTSEVEFRNVYNKLPGPHKKLLILPADAGHGWSMLGYSGPEGNVTDEINAFLKAND